MQVLKLFSVINIYKVVIFLLILIIIFGVNYHFIAIDKALSFSNMVQHISFVSRIRKNNKNKLEEAYSSLAIQGIKGIGTIENLQDIDKFILCNSWDVDLYNYFLDTNKKSLSIKEKKDLTFINSLNNINSFCTTKYLE